MFHPPPTPTNENRSITKGKEGKTKLYYLAGEVQRIRTMAPGSNTLFRKGRIANRLGRSTISSITTKGNLRRRDSGKRNNGEEKKMGDGVIDDRMRNQIFKWRGKLINIIILSQSAKPSQAKSN